MLGDLDLVRRIFEPERLDRVGEVDVVAVAKELVRTVRDRPGPRLVAFATRLRGVPIGLELVAERALQRTNPFDSRPEPLSRRGRHSLLADPEAAMRTVLGRQDREKALNPESHVLAFGRFSRLDARTEEELEVAVLEPLHSQNMRLSRTNATIHSPSVRTRSQRVVRESGVEDGVFLYRANLASFRDTAWTDIERVRDGITKQIAGVPTLERAAVAFTATLRRSFETCALARLFVLAPLKRLPEAEQGWARDLASSIGHAAEVSPETPTLCLLGSAGIEPAWNDRTKSAGHRAIPLLDRNFIANAPMIAGLLHALHLDPQQRETGGPIQLRPMAGGLNARFFVEDAAISVDEQDRHVIASRPFVTRYGIKSVFGMGGSYVTGEIAIAIIFTTEKLTATEVDRYTTFISTFKMATSDAAAGRRFLD